MKTNQLIISFLTFIFLSSCSGTHYLYVYDSPKGLDFRTGKWLVNNIDADVSSRAKEKLTLYLLDELNNMGEDSIYFVDNIQFDYIVPGQFQGNVSPTLLELLKSTTDFDYLINVKAQENKNELSDIMVLAPGLPGKSESEVWIEAYEVKTGAKIYSQRIIASVTHKEGDNEVYFSKSSNSLIFDALKKGLKELKKNSAKR